MGVPFSTSKHHANPCLSQSHLALTPNYSGSVSNDPLDLEFQILNAFTTDVFGGNPAVVIFLKDQMPPDDLLERINANLNQPIVVYVSPPTSTSPPKEGSAVFGLRWFGPRNEVHICGHGTLAAAEAIFRQLDPAKNVTTLEFETLSGTLTAHRVGEQIMMELPAGTTVPASTSETAVVQNIFARALGKASVDINYIGYGGPGFSNYLLVEAELAPRTQILVVTSASRAEGIAYETRMFAPSIGVREDHVCGSAHCLNAPYWAVKVQDADGEYTAGKPQHAKAVSMRGGDIWAAYFAAAGRVRVRGDVKRVAVGTLKLGDVVG
ncbi:hypothetical protein B0H14DRAFT_3429275 [Mycena olivaceomarginata]|nr:hypothetical protein B0H14DRAFT_3429275 [Mycena olivaceomarginata]